MNSAILDYLNEFEKDPNNIEEFKINYLKNFFYPKAKKFLQCEMNEFKLAATKNRVWFMNINNQNIEIIYFYKDEKYFIRKNKDSKQIEEINIESSDYSSDSDNNINNIANNSNKTCLNKFCIII